MVQVSIIVPVFNACTFIRKCMDSVIVQTMTEGLECILIDDCSTDESVKVINDYINENNCKGISFRLLRQDHNQGPSAARNRGIREARGGYLFFLDADDTIPPDCIELLYELARKYDADYVQGKYNVNDNEGASCDTLRDENENKNGKSGLPEFMDDRREIKRLLLNHNKIQFTPHNRLVRRKMIIDNDLFFNEEIKVREDFLWMTFVAKYVERFAFCEVPTYNRGYNENSLTNHIDREREIKGYRVLIETMVLNYDPFLLGYQKELALEALIMALKAGFYHDKTERQHLIGTVNKGNSQLEKLILSLYFRTKSDTIKTKLLHFLIRVYKSK